MSISVEYGEDKVLISSRYGKNIENNVHSGGDMINISSVLPAVMAAECMKGQEVSGGEVATLQHGAPLRHHSPDLSLLVPGRGGAGRGCMRRAGATRGC